MILWKNVDPTEQTKGLIDAVHRLAKRWDCLDEKRILHICPDIPASKEIVCFSIYEHEANKIKWLLHGGFCADKKDNWTINT